MNRMPSASFRRAVALSALLGIPVGLFGTAFYWVWHWLHAQVWERFPQPVNRIWISAVLGLVIGLLITWMWDPGTMSDIVNHLHHSGKLPVADNKPIIPMALIGLVGGSSAGPEGVLTQVCGSMGSWLADRLGESSLMRILTQAGMGAGFGAFLGAPMGGAILWLEMPHRHGLEYYESLIPTLTTSGVGYLVMSALTGTNLQPIWHLPAFEPASLLHVGIALAMGVAAGGVAVLYSWLFRGVGVFFRAMQVPIWVKTSLAGLLIGSIGALFPLTYFYGKNEINPLIAGNFPLWAVAGMLFCKMLASSITIRGRWQGGLIVPHLFMGAALGKLVAMVVPGINPTLAILTGMAAYNAAATQTPLASGLIVLEMTTGGIGAAIPVFLASLVGFFVGQRVEVIGYKSHRLELPGLATRQTDPLPQPAGD